MLMRGKTPIAQKLRAPRTALQTYAFVLAAKLTLNVNPEYTKRINVASVVDWPTVETTMASLRPDWKRCASDRESNSGLLIRTYATITGVSFNQTV